MGQLVCLLGIYVNLVLCMCMLRDDTHSCCTVTFVRVDVCVWHVRPACESEPSPSEASSNFVPSYIGIFRYFDG